MSITRRSFLKGILLACAAPAIVRIESIMPVKPLNVYYDREVLFLSTPTINDFNNSRWVRALFRNTVLIHKEYLDSHIIKQDHIREAEEWIKSIINEPYSNVLGRSTITNW